jgi:hypothetical protein
VDCVSGWGWRNWRDGIHHSSQSSVSVSFPLNPYITLTGMLEPYFYNPSRATLLSPIILPPYLTVMLPHSLILELLVIEGAGSGVGK